ncbi:MAG: Crp/Fnr family transcriptional regulator [Gammaproteobacteria bacterium]|nr:Crp/Fnr family transcriptional regulator [Gammaproteobacteria bacterium]
MAINYDNFIVKPGESTQCAQCVVRKLALFQGVKLENLEWTQAIRQEQFILKPKRRLFEEGEPPRYAYTLFSGWVAQYQTSPDGGRMIHQFALPGDFIGFQAKSGHPIDYSAQALTEITVCAFPVKELNKVLKELPELSNRLIDMHSHTIKLCRQHMLSVGRKSAKQRLAYLFLELFHRVKAIGDLMPGTEEDSIAFPLSQEDLADALGLTSVHVSRTLRELTDEGLVSVRHRRLTILNEPALTDLAQFDKAIVIQDHPLL